MFYELCFALTSAVDGMTKLEEKNKKQKKQKTKKNEKKNDYLLCRSFVHNPF